MPGAIALAFGTALVFSRISQLSTTTTLMHDFVSYVVPASSFSSGLGEPYADFWDVKPPLLIGHLTPWIEVFGASLRGFYVLYALWLALALFCAWRILRSFAPGWLAATAFASATIVMAATGSLAMFFPSELPGLALVLLGLMLVIEFPGSGWALVTAAFATTAAGQFKDVYVFAPLVLVPVVWAAPNRVGATLRVVGGAAAAAIVTVSYLVSTGSFGAYREVLAWKRQQYPMPDPAELLSSMVDLVAVNGSGLILGLGGALVIAFLWQARRPAGADTPTPSPDASRRQPSVPALVLVLWLLLAAGFAWQRMPTAAHYVISLQLPTVFAIVAVFQIAARTTGTTGGRPALVLAALTVACLIPAPGLFGDYLSEARSASPPWMINAVRKLEQPQDVSPYRLPGELTPPGRCMQVAYGWTAGAYHHYGGRPSCSRYFLSRLITTPGQRAALRSQVIAGGPAVVVYIPAIADLNVAEYDKSTLPWSKVLAGCYVKRSSGVYSARGKTRDEVSACIARIVDDAGLSGA